MTDQNDNSQRGKVMRVDGIVLQGADWMGRHHGVHHLDKLKMGSSSEKDVWLENKLILQVASSTWKG
jgi:hypothetical protein